MNRADIESLRRVEQEAPEWAQDYVLRIYGKKGKEGVLHAFQAWSYAGLTPLVAAYFCVIAPHEKPLIQLGTVTATAQRERELLARFSGYSGWTVRARSRAESLSGIKKTP